MIRLFVLIGIIGGAGVVYLATYGVDPEGQLPPAVSQLVKFEAEGEVPGANDLVDNPEAGHGIFEVPIEDEAQLEMALANMPSMSGMDMGGMEMSEGSTMEMTEGATMEMAEGSTMEMAEGATMEMTEGAAMEMAEEEGDHGEGMAMGGLKITDDGAFDRELDLTMSEWKYSNMQIDVKMGERIKFNVRNGGNIPHEFMFMTMPAMTAVNYRVNRADWSLLEHEALFEQALVLPGGEFSFIVQVMQSGSWMFMCMLPYHMQMGMMGQMATEGMAMDMNMDM